MESAASERKEIGMDLPEVVSASEWETAQQRLRAKEKELTRRRLGWEHPWYSWGGGDFGVDFGTSPAEPKEGAYQDGEGFALSVFLRDGGDVYRTYFTRNRGVEAIGPVWSFLDRAPFGRQETWEDSPASYPQTEPYTWWRRHDEYEEG